MIPQINRLVKNNQNLRNVAARTRQSNVSFIPVASYVTIGNYNKNVVNTIVLTNAFHPMTQTRSIMRQLGPDQEDIYMGNISYDATVDDVKSAVEQHATVHNVSLPKNRETGRGRGFAFVTIDKSQTDRVVEAINGSQVLGRRVNCRKAEQRAPRQEEPQDSPLF
eukprot:TRINITY_DN819_c0_g1_i1.p1 TRINITY_DN819_c0_g1~~TRINITY_DN819_c0_g1_i1.p1  ORF type:complete len:165 (-),score=16.13 TRINITY_DN819_c0_g1_i1:135-629(-)